MGQTFYPSEYPGLNELAKYLGETLSAHEVEGWHRFRMDIKKDGNKVLVDNIGLFSIENDEVV